MKKIAYWPVDINSPNNPVSSIWRQKGMPSQRYRNLCNHSLGCPHNLVNMCILVYIAWNQKHMNFQSFLRSYGIYPAPEEFPHNGISPFTSSKNQLAEKKIMLMFVRCSMIDIFTFIRHESIPIFICEISPGAIHWKIFDTFLC